MPLYSMSQLIDKTLVLAKSMNIYKAADILALGTAGAKPNFVMRAGDSFTVDSYLLSGGAGTSSYGIKYAARKYNYFLFYRGIEYYAVAIIDGAFSGVDIKAEGILTVEQQAEKEAEDNKSIFDKIADGASSIFGDVHTFIKIVLALVVIYLIVVYILPGIKEYKKA